VNFSLDQFRSKAIVQTVLGALARYNLPVSSFEIEVTESILFHDEPVVRETIEALAAAGLRLVLDDFGTGFSSLRHLQEFPIDAVKIDRCFVEGLPSRSRSVAIVHAVLDLCRRLDIRVTAEGIETAEQFAMLRTLGCDCAQGYLICRPRPLDEATAIVRQPERLVA
jgi:EAL domain-containing protein (putative c-di-GMP-specific phosphodiesterase class I)